MTNRERFYKIMKGEKPDRIPCVHFGYWRELLLEWAEQGHITREMAEKTDDGNEYDRELDKILGWDFCYASNWCVNTGLFPALEEKTIRTDGEGEYVSDSVGVIHYRKKDIVSIPVEVDYLLKDRETFESVFKPRMRFTPQRFIDSCLPRIESEWETPKGLYAGSAFGEIRNMLTVIGMSYMMCDDYDLFKEIIHTYQDMQYESVKYVLEQGYSFDFLHFWEDICFKNGPLISPAIFEELTGEYYHRMSELAKKYGIEYLSVDCDGDIAQLISVWAEHGINVMFPIEYGTWHGDYANIRKIADVKGVGGMNKEVLRQDKASVKAEVERLKPLIEMKGYLPCPDHRLVPGSKWELVQYYIELIKNIR